MELLAKVIVYPVLGIVYVILRCLSRLHVSRLPSFRTAFSNTVSYIQDMVEWLTLADNRYFAGWVVLGQLAAMAVIVEFDYISDFIDYLISVESNLFIVFASNFVAAIVIYCILHIMGFAILGTLGTVVHFIGPIVLLPSIDCLVYLLSHLFYRTTRAVAHFIVFGLKNRRACQFLSALAAVVLGVSKAKVFAAIPIFIGIFLTVPDLEPDPWVDFKLRFAHFLVSNMDWNDDADSSKNAVVRSKASKLVSCNEMMPDLGPIVFSQESTASFEQLEQSLDSPTSKDWIVEKEYKIGLGSMTTSMRGDVIDVQVFTPFSGVKKRTIANTARSKYNLDMSARYWGDHPQEGILNKAYDGSLEVDKFHCIGVDKWIELCGSQNYVFKENVNVLEKNSL